jgi:hypothetical protein
MGGQACVFYGAAEFSRDTDVTLLADPENLKRLHHALDDLKAEVVAVPPFEYQYLQRGHAIHFRCSHPEAEGMRLDIMSIMRGVDEFPALWSRRTTAELDPGESYELMSLPDLVRAKKTQRDKDWPMIRRLIEADYQNHWESPDEAQIRFWFKEARTPELLTALAARFPDMHSATKSERPCLCVLGDDAAVEQALEQEERKERALDRAYWRPLKKELEALRHERGKDNKP